MASYRYLDPRGSPESSSGYQTWAQLRSSTPRVAGSHRRRPILVHERQGREVGPDRLVLKTQSAEVHPNWTRAPGRSRVALGSDSSASASSPAGFHFVAAALRVAYGQALETLFALAAAAGQAPHCAVGWMLAYRNDELLDIVRGMTTGRPSIERDPTVADPSLSALAKAVMSATPYDQGKRDSLAGDFAKVWRRWASEFLDERATSEYNSFKHGMRASLGGFTLAMGPEVAPGEAAPTLSNSSMAPNRSQATAVSSAKPPSMISRSEGPRSHS